MKKYWFITAVILLLARIACAQNGYQAFKGIAQASGPANKRPVYKPAYLLYSQTYCKLTVGNEVYYFMPTWIDSHYEEDTMSSIEDIYREKSKILPDTGYSIYMVSRYFGNKTMSIGIETPSGTKSYYIKNVLFYDCTRKINGKLYTEDLVDLDNRANAAMAAYRAKKARIKREKQIADSTEHANHLRDELNKKLAILNSGKNFNRLTFNTANYLQKTLEASLYAKGLNVSAEGDVTLLIDAQGNITGCIPDERSARTMIKYVPYLNEAIKELRLQVPPFIADGVAYASYYPNLWLDIFIKVNYDGR